MGPDTERGQQAIYVTRTTDLVPSLTVSKKQDGMRIQVQRKQIKLQEYYTKTIGGMFGEVRSKEGF